jgi:hypothetical protein
MILIAHLLFGALIGEKIANPILAIILSLLGHYFLDIFPHFDYSFQNIKERKWKKAKFEYLKISLDFLSAILLIFLFSNNSLLVYICAFFAIVPDGLSILHLFIPNNLLLKKHREIHQIKVHFLTIKQEKNMKKSSFFWRIANQVAVVIFSIIMLKY